MTDPEVPDAIHQLVAQLDEIPQDVVPPGPLTTAALDALDRSAGKPVTETQIVEDVDGVPMVVPSDRPAGTYAGGVIHHRDLPAGITPEAARDRWPNLDFTDDGGTAA